MNPRTNQIRLSVNGFDYHIFHAQIMRSKRKGELNSQVFNNQPQRIMMDGQQMMECIRF